VRPDRVEARRIAPQRAEHALVHAPRLLLADGIGELRERPRERAEPSDAGDHEQILPEEPREQAPSQLSAAPKKGHAGERSRERRSVSTDPRPASPSSDAGAPCLPARESAACSLYARARLVSAFLFGGLVARGRFRAASAPRALARTRGFSRRGELRGAPLAASLRSRRRAGARRDT